LSAMISLLRVPDPDVVITHSPILMIGLPVLALRILKGTPFVYHVQDIYPDVAIQSGALRPGIWTNLLAHLERAAYKLGAAIPVISDGFVDLMVGKGVARDRIALIPNCVDTDLIRPLPKLSRLRRQLGLEDKFVVLYAGNVGFGQGLEAVIQTAGLLVDQTSIHFLIVGEGATLDSLTGMVKQMALPNVTFAGFQPRESVPDVLATADVSLVPMKKGVALHSVPSKVWSIMASGRPMIISVDGTSDTYRIVTTAGAGVAVEPENPEALCQAIQSMYASPASLETMGARGREYVESNLGRSVAARRFEELLRQVVPQ
jgi:putative colanic acid biosynthesis glycosyltransferase WcaI